MGVLDIVARNLASSMFKKFGTAVLFKERQSGDYDSANARVKTMEIEHSTYGMVTDYQEGEASGLARSGDKKVLVASKDLPRTPSVSWRIRFNDRWFEIHRVIVTYSGEERAIVEILARGS